VKTKDLSRSEKKPFAKSIGEKTTRCMLVVGRITE